MSVWALKVSTESELQKLREETLDNPRALPLVWLAELFLED
jgi:hypothetical protein